MYLVMKTHSAYFIITQDTKSAYKNNVHQKKHPDA